MDLIVKVIWESIDVPSYINPHFRVVLPSQTIISTILVAAGLSFCPGFFEVLTSETAPSLKWLKSISPIIPPKVWGVYIVILHQKSHKPLLYIGSGTQAQMGVRSRMAHYDYGAQLPRHVQTALNDGYRIVHKALLFWSPIPPAANVPTLRTAYVAAEAAMTCIFGAFRKRNKSYGFGNLCPWTQDLFEWDGLCSHSPLLELILGDFDLDAEQLEKKAAATKEKKRQQDREYHQNMQANPTPEYRERMRKKSEKRKPALKAYYANCRANKTFYCDTCKVACRNNADLKIHNETPRHSKKVEMGDDDYHCQACDISFKYKSHFTLHCTSKGHIAKTAQATTDT